MSKTNFIKKNKTLSKIEWFVVFSFIVMLLSLIIISMFS